MALGESPSDAQIILLAVELCSAASLGALRTLHAQHSDVLASELVCRILLTFLPEEFEAPQLISLLKFLAVENHDEIFDAPIDASSVANLTEREAQIRLQSLQIQHLLPPTAENSGASNIERFLVQLAHQIDATTGDLPTVLQLVEPFVDTSDYLRQWLISNLLPLLRRDYEFYPGSDARLSIPEIEVLRGTAGVEALLLHTRIISNNKNIGRDLRSLVGPWKYGESKNKRRRVDAAGANTVSTNEVESDGLSIGTGWEDVNEWILATSADDFHLSLQAVEQWDGPGDIDLGGYATVVISGPQDQARLQYCRTVLAIIYSTDDSSPEVLEGCKKLLKRAEAVMCLEPQISLDSSIPLPDMPPFPFTKAHTSRADLLRGVLLRPTNILTEPSAVTLSFLGAIMVSLQIMQIGNLQMSPRQAVDLCIFDDGDRQRQELRRMLDHLTRTRGSDEDWPHLRDQLLWLRSWTSPVGGTPQFARLAMFGNIEREHMEKAFLNALLLANQYQTTIEIYMRSPDRPLSQDVVESCIRDAILNSYDNASNGNRTRGGMKRASEILKTFLPYISPSSPIHKLEYLLAATHALSFYHLTLQHGVPFQPVSIRVHQDPISLIEKVLQQNSKAYTKLDDLISIGRNFALAGLPISASNSQNFSTADALTLTATRRITYLAITSALAASDFDTAYSYILTRLSLTASSASDDTSWRCAYAAGSYQPTTPPVSLPARISLLSKRMELLSLALTLAPTPDPLPEILGAWRTCEADLDALRTAEKAQESAWDDAGDGLVPGGFDPTDGRSDDIRATAREREKRRVQRAEDEGPRGLFDVARSVAGRIGSGAFPLRAPGRGVQVRDEAPPDGGASTQLTGSQRMRKRDVVSNMVTGGLVSGIGWVLGAQPVKKEDEGGNE